MTVRRVQAGWGGTSLLPLLLGAGLAAETSPRGKIRSPSSPWYPASSSSLAGAPGVGGPVLWSDPLHRSQDPRGSRELWPLGKESPPLAGCWDTNGGDTGGLAVGCRALTPVF